MWVLWTGGYFIVGYFIECKRPLILYHNIIKIHNNVMWDLQYYVEYSSIQAKCDEYLGSCMLLMNNLYQIARNPSSDHVC